MADGPVPLPPGPVAVVPREPIGDTMMTLVVAENLRRAGREVVVFSALAVQLAEWLPRFAVAAPDDRERFQGCGLRVMQSSDAGRELPQDGARLVLGADPLLDRRAPRVEGYLAICRERLGIAAPVRSNGLVPPAGVTLRAHPRRVVLAPGAADPRREWRPSRFLAVAQGLAARGREPLFLVEPAARARWEERLAGRHALECHQRLDAVARVLCEAGVCVGNDSGIGHLASSVGTPTVTLFVRRRPAVHWRPAFAPSEALLPRLALPSTWLRRRTWSLFLSPAAVLAAVERLED